jgi:hypothetical protein
VKNEKGGSFVQDRTCGYWVVILLLFIAIVVVAVI